MAKDFWGSFFRSPDTYDPMASIRQQLTALRSQVPGFVARQKALTAEDIAKSRKRGMENIGEQTYAEKGWGRGFDPRTGETQPGSIFSRLSTELEEGLAREKSRADLASEMAGFGMESDILGQLSGMPEPEDAYQPSPFMNVLSELFKTGISSLTNTPYGGGGEFGSGAFSPKQDFYSRYLSAPATVIPEANYPSWQDILKGGGY